ncbi:MAG: hypothetical protein IPL55_03390 [Saprospiraceae bacterium]|nr:hypothetical protein [Saprospiraceae bacterium]
MIKLFRQIRKTLLNKGQFDIGSRAGQTTKYFKFAIGEIDTCPYRDNILVKLKYLINRCAVGTQYETINYIMYPKAHK